MFLLMILALVKTSSVSGMSGMRNIASKSYTNENLGIDKYSNIFRNTISNDKTRIKEDIKLSKNAIRLEDLYIKA